jgi:hypothetical protein
MCHLKNFIQIKTFGITFATYIDFFFCQSNSQIQTSRPYAPPALLVFAHYQVIIRIDIKYLKIIGGFRCNNMLGLVASFD